MSPRYSLPSALDDRRAFSFAEARSLGASRGRLAGSDLVTPFRGARLHRGSERDLQARCAAYAATAAPGVFFSHSTAAELWEIPVPSSPNAAIHASVHWPARAPAAHGIIGHAPRAAHAQVTMRNGLRVSSPARTWCDLATIHDVDALVVAADFIVHRKRTMATLVDLRRAFENHPSRRFRSRLAEALELVNDRSESPQETRMRLALGRAGLTGIQVNAEITANGRRYRADISFPARSLILEYQGDHHREQGQYRRDLTRTSNLQAAGWTVVQFGPDDIRDEVSFVELVRHFLSARPTWRESRLAQR